jgi:aspartate/methionine/tyrosine aminotransferase
MLLADEVYQVNIFDEKEKPFVSFKKVLREMSKEVAEGVELVSFHSISKGVSGECGRRGGYFEAVNIRDDVMEQIYKMASVSLCPPLTGQVSNLSPAQTCTPLPVSSYPSALPLPYSLPTLSHPRSRSTHTDP